MIDYDMPFDVYERELREQDNSIVLMLDRGDGTCAVVKRLMFHYTMVMSEIGNFETCGERFCYTSDPLEVIEAVTEWQSRGWEGEPVGWHRHPDTGRRRPGGDPEKEHTQW